MSNIPYPDYDTDNEPEEDPDCTPEEWAEHLRQQDQAEHAALDSLEERLSPLQGVMTEVRKEE